jgi:hypothetical protein
VATPPAAAEAGVEKVEGVAVAAGVVVVQPVIIHTHTQI